MGVIDDDNQRERDIARRPARPSGGPFDLRPRGIETTDAERALVVNAIQEGDKHIVISWRSDIDPGFRDATGLTPENARRLARALDHAATLIEAVMTCDDCGRTDGTHDPEVEH